jgi:hypothetical protein
MRILLLFILLFASTALAEDFVKVGSESNCFDVFISNDTATDGSGLTGLAHNSGSLSCYFHRSDASSATQITLADMTLGTFTSGGFKEVSAANMPGWYQLCPPNTAFASGKNVNIQCKGAADMAPMNLRIVLLDALPVVSCSGGGGGSRPGMQ